MYREDVTRVWAVQVSTRPTWTYRLEGEGGPVMGETLFNSADDALRSVRNWMGGQVSD